MLVSRIVQTALLIGFAVKRGSADGQVIQATDGSVQSYIAFAERTDVGTQIAATGTVSVAAGDVGREIYVKLGGTVTQDGYGMPTADGSLIAATTTNYVCVQFLKSGVIGDIVPARPVSFKLP